MIDRIAERRQPVILLIEQANGWRCFRFEDEVSEPDAHAGGSDRPIARCRDAASQAIRTSL